MSDIDYSALEDAVVTIETEDGESMECQLVCVFEYNEQDYAAFAELDNEEHEVYFFTLNTKVKKKETEFAFDIVDDEELLEELLSALQEITDAEFEEDDDDDNNIIIDDGEEDEEVFDEEDDSKWDQFINKKLD